MLPKKKHEKIKDKKSKNILLRSNNAIKSNLLEPHSKSKIINNKTGNKSQDKRIKNKSISNYNNQKYELRNINTEAFGYKQKTEKPKANTIINRMNTTKAQDNLFNICKMSNFLQNTNFKKTIIIDNEGNNNLELLIDQGNNDTNIKNNNKVKEIELITESKEKEDNVNTETTNLFTTSYENNNLMKNTSNDKQNSEIKLIINENKGNNEEKISDIKRLDEYSQIFNLLNENIEQFKNIFIKKETKENKKIKNNPSQTIPNDDIPSTKKNINIIPLKERLSSKMKHNKNIFKKNQITSPSNLKSGKKKTINMNENKESIINNNKDIEEIFNEGNLNNSFSKIYEKDKSTSEIYSFLGSFTQEDFFQQSPSNLKHSSKLLSKYILEENLENLDNKESDKDDINIDTCGTEGQVKFGELKNRKINPHFFSSDYTNKNIIKPVKTSVNEKKKNIQKEQKDCRIF